MIGLSFSMILPMIGAAPSFDRTSPAGHDEETVYDFFLRMKDELLWPRILVRSAPPPDEI